MIGTRSSIYHITKTGTCKGGNGGKTLLSPSFLGNAKIRLVVIPYFWPISFDLTDCI
nr:MAG TPA: hypothetical protein [Bacteriophage sp.]